MAEEKIKRYRNEKLESYIEGEPYVEITHLGTKFHYNSLHDLHCECGPAVDQYDGYKEWWLDGYLFDNEDCWKIELEKQNPKEVFCFIGENSYKNIEL